MGERKIATFPRPYKMRSGRILQELEQYRSDRLTDKVTSLKDSLDAQYKADERGRVFDRPCQVLDDGDLDEH